MDILLSRKTLIVSSILLGLVLIVLAISSLTRAQSFHLAKADPSEGDTPHQYTHVVLTFNNQLATSPGTNQFTISPQIEGHSRIAGKSITFVPTAAFNTGIKYTATLKNVHNQSGESIGNVSVTFTPRYVEYTALPEDIQKELNHDPEDKPSAIYDPQSIVIGGETSLTDSGVSSDQIDNLKTAFYNFFVSQKRQVRTIDLSDLQKAPHVYGTFNDSVGFTVSISGTATYKARLDYTDVYDIHLYLNNLKTGQPVFNSGPLGEPKT